MKILVIGSGGREHALVWKLSQSPSVKKIFCAPGSDAIAELADPVAIAPEKLDELAGFAAKQAVDLTLAGPELPLALGIADVFAARGLKLFGPVRAAAQLEASKAFAKALLKETGIPTASFETFADASAARAYLERTPPPYVVKADGLAAGKGVLICPCRQDAEAAVDEILVRKTFGAAGAKIVIEEFLSGEEASFMALIDGEHILPLATSQDHKRVFDHDEGANTGGMGAYSPAPVVTPEVHDKVLSAILRPLLEGLRKRNICYRGLLYVGLMITDAGPKVLEFNVRFGDPECQPIMMRLKSDLVPLLEATITGSLHQIQPQWHDDAAACVVLCSQGYPGPYPKGSEIHGLEKLRSWSRGFVFHAGTTRAGDSWVTSGGRVLGVTARGGSITEAVGEAYSAVRQISWDGMHYRTDIGRRAVR